MQLRRALLDIRLQTWYDPLLGGEGKALSSAVRSTHKQSGNTTRTTQRMLRVSAWSMKMKKPTTKRGPKSRVDATVHVASIGRNTPMEAPTRVTPPDDAWAVSDETWTLDRLTSIVAVLSNVVERLSTELHECKEQAKGRAAYRSLQDIEAQLIIEAYIRKAAYNGRRTRANEHAVTHDRAEATRRDTRVAKAGA
jgi:hypothetical protein